MELGIKGNETHGDEIIKILEMLGGKNRYEMRGSIYNNYFYYIDGEYKDISYSYIGPDEINGYKIFSLDEFLEKFPYKVGDKVEVWVNHEHFSGPRAELEVAEIKSMRWNSARCEVAYRMKDISGEFYKNEIKGKVDDKVNECEVNKEIVMNENKPLFKPGDVVKLKGCTDKNLYWIVMDVIKDGYIFNDGKKYLFDVQHNYEKSNRKVINLQPDKIAHLSINNEKYADQIEIDLGDNYEYKFEMNKLYIVKKKPKYPKSYEECCDVLNIDPIRIIEYDESWGRRSLTQYDTDILAQLKHFRKLLICRYAYWEIAGEELGLNKPWEPDFSDDSPKYNIFKYENAITLSDNNWSNRILVFPTLEMRNAFYENFKDLIEQCKELL